MSKNRTFKALRLLLLAALVISGCPLETANTLYWKSDRLTIEQSPGGNSLFIAFNDKDGKAQTVSGTPSGSLQELWNDGTVAVYITAAGLTQLVTQGATVSTNTVYSDNTAIEELDTAGVLDYKFYFADSSTRTAAYQAQLLKTGRQLTAEFTPVGGGAAQTRPVTQAYNPSSSLNLDFDNPTLAGSAHLQVTKPALYADVNGVLFSSYNRDNTSGGAAVIYNLDVFKRSDNSNYILVYFDLTESYMSFRMCP